jgi:hypothetical protein
MKRKLRWKNDEGEMMEAMAHSFKVATETDPNVSSDLGGIGLPNERDNMDQ